RAVAGPTMALVRERVGLRSGVLR
ncbi:MAG: hypothetical protein QOH66_933, partial [Actinomycetota bacterium]|nr:hypothetical protein [Actinomycetota bacterium]